MKIIVCLDGKNGMLFNKRRQSADRALVEKILDITKGNTLWMHPYSQKLFKGLSNNIHVDEYFLELAGENEYCFVETQDVTPYLKSIEEVVIFRWNRIYPADFWFSVKLIEEFRKNDEMLSFPGNSHEKISVEVYSK